MKKKKFLLLLLVGLLLAVGWDAYINRQPTFFGQTLIRYIHRTTYIATEEQFGQSLRAVADKLLAPLDIADVNAISELTRIRALAETDFRSNEISAETRRLVITLCNRLEQINAERERHAAQYRSLLETQPRSLQGAATAERHREFFVDQHLQRWKQFVDQQRPRVMRDLTRLREEERERERGRS